MGAGYRLREAHQAAANPTPPNHPTHLGEREPCRISSAPIEQPGISHDSQHPLTETGHLP